MRRRLLLLCAPLALSACGSAVRTPEPLDARQALQWQAWIDPALKGQVSLGEVRGADAPAVGRLQQTLGWLWGQRTETAALADGLEDQLRALSLLAALPGQGRFTLDVELQQLQADGLLGAAEAQIAIVYTLREGSRTRYQRRVRAQGSAGWAHHALASERQRQAKEAALRESLRLLAQDLVALRV